jgi:hypothetical protein
VSDILSARVVDPTLAATPIAALVCAAIVAQLRRQYRDDLNRDRALCERLDRAGHTADHVRRRIAVTRAALAEMEGA